MHIDQTFTTLGKNAIINGDFSFSGSTHILGNLTGEIRMLNQAKLSLQIGSIVNANIEGFDLDIYGDFSGEIKSKGVVTIFPTATVNGKIIAHSLEILPGANVNMNGHTNHQDDGAGVTAPS